jgi:hypothetical protein
MISKQLSDAIYAFALLTADEQRRFIGFVQGPSAELPELKHKQKHRDPPKYWNETDTKRVVEFMEDSVIMSKQAKEKKLLLLCRALGRDRKSVQNKIGKLKSKKPN